MSDVEADIDPDLAGNPYVVDPPTSFEPVETLDRATAEREVEQLREAIRYHDYRYYVEDDPVIADRTYDRLFDRLQDLEDTFDLVEPDSPTQRVGGEPVDELETVEHVTPLLSLDGSAEAGAVRDFDRRVRDRLDGEPVEYVCEPKFDGLSIEVVYRDGRYERAATRGDGLEGDDVTENVRTIPSVPGRLRGEPPSMLAVRGEIYMPRDAFQAFNRERIEKGEEPFANPRNAAAGTVRQLDPSVTAERPLACVFYDVLESSEGFDTHWAAHEGLQTYGLRASPRAELVGDIDAAIRYRHDLLSEREALNYEVDGTVIKVNDREQCDRLGTTSRAPRWAFAYKFPARADETTVVDITVQVGRTGRVTPVALLDPVDVGGVTVSRASLHNPEEVEALEVDVGDVVRVERAGDVIPYVSEVVEHRSDGAFTFPDSCPVCASPIERDGPLAFCTGGLGCPAQRRRSLEHYVSSKGLDIEGLGPERLEQLEAAGLVEEIPDLYRLTPEELASLEGWGERSARNVLGEIEASKHPSLAAFLAALGIPGVGETTAQAVADHFDSFEDIVNADVNDLQAVEDIGPVVAQNIREFVTTEENRRVIDDLLELGVTPEAPSAEGVEEAATALEGLTFVFTGSLPFGSRDDVAEVVERHGGTVTSSVSGNTDYLVIGENPGRTKRDDAAANAVPVIDPFEFATLLAERGVMTFEEA